MRVAALGGGHGLAASLGAVRRYASDVTAVVSVADDGGSSGRLRAALGIPAPGDLRKSLVALAEPGSVWARTFEHRFDAGELTGHALGNLVLAALAETTGDFAAAVDHAAQLLGCDGRVLPATSGPVVLEAECSDGTRLRGQVAIVHGGPVARISFEPADPPTPPAVLEALAGADQLVIGPGSLFTSVLAVSAVPAVREAIAAASATRVYVCNLRTDPETTGFEVADHVSALARHGVAVDVVLCDPGSLPRGHLEVACVERPVALDDGSAHDPVRLADALAGLVG